MHHKIALLVFVTLVHIRAVSASPIIAVDLDPSAGGVQGVLSVSLGATFGVDIVVIGDGTPFDNATLDTPFNDSGAVLALSGNPLAGTLANNAVSIDAVGPFTFVSPGDPLTTSIAAPPAGFASGMGGAGLQAFGVYVPVGTFSILSLTFDAVAVGTSTIDVTGIFGAPPLVWIGQGVLLDGIEAGLVTVEQGQPIPEPGTLYLLGTGFFVSMGWRGRMLRARSRRTALDPACVNDSDRRV